VSTIENHVIGQLRVGQAKVVDIDWAGDDFVLIDLLSTQNLGVEFRGAPKSELATVATLDLKKNKLDQVFGPSQTKVANAVVGSYGVRQVNGKWTGFFGGYTIETDRGVAHRRTIDDYLVEDLYHYDLESGSFGFA